MYNKLYTDKLSEKSWTSYPRPSMVRKKWLSLNGYWNFEINGEKQKDILVPFCKESLICDIGKVDCESMRYTKKFNIEKTFMNDSMLLHFGAVDQKAKVYINDNFVGEHKGGYLPFYFDIRSYLHEGENTICVDVEDKLEQKYPYGKQRKKRGGMWYTPVSGIWQSVWIEPVAREHIESINVSSKKNKLHIKINGVDTGNINIEGQTHEFSNGSIDIEIQDAIYWSPENPKLYRFSIKTSHDYIESYFALRDISTKVINGKWRILLNDKPYFFHGVLDQGYFSDGIYTPASEKLFTEDIIRLKKLGFNTIRKHIKIEPEIFYYECDRLGMIVFQDMVNNGRYRFFRDTVLPTIGIQNISDKYLNTNKNTRKIFLDHMRETVKHLKNHPCIVLWTIFNEAWGQFEADKAYEILKNIDSSRLIDATSGWFTQKKSDVISKHIYFRPIKNFCGDRPYILSEYGGYVWKINEHSYNTQKTYGYKIFKTQSDYIAAIKKLFDNLVLLSEKGLNAAIYTQLSDVEDETNGLITYNRKVQKINPDDISAYAKKLQEGVNK